MSDSDTPRSELASAEPAARQEVRERLQAELAWLASEAPPTVARHARIVLERLSGKSVQSIAQSLGVHPNTVRNCVRRFERLGLRGLAHASAGRPKQLAYTEGVRDEIGRVAMATPESLGLPFPVWSLRRLRTYLVGRGLITGISIEGLRQILNGLPLPSGHWRTTPRTQPTTNAATLRTLQKWVEAGSAPQAVRARIVLGRLGGLTEEETAAAVNIGVSTVRRWMSRFRRHGLLGLQASRTSAARLNAHVRGTIVRVARSDPHRYGVEAEQWYLSTLRRALIDGRVVRQITERQLAAVLAGAGIFLDRAIDLDRPGRDSAAG